MKFKRGFTLIELLIVVAIIAILAAIAVPNFLEAQVRAKVSNMKANLRTLATAIESYTVDNNKIPMMTYAPLNPPSGSWSTPEQFKFYPGYPALGRPASLTSPIAYISSTAPMVDVFRKAHKFTTELSYQVMYLPSNAYRLPYTLNISEPTYVAQTNAYGSWVMHSSGPDTYYQNKPNERVDYGGAGSTGAINTSYDSTNGTVSNGDIMRSQKRSEQGHAGPSGQVF